MCVLLADIGRFACLCYSGCMRYLMGLIRLEEISETGVINLNWWFQRGMPGSYQLVGNVSFEMLYCIFFSPSPCGKELHSTVIKPNLYLNLLSTVTAEQAISLHSKV